MSRSYFEYKPAVSCFIRTLFINNVPSHVRVKKNASATPHPCRGVGWEGLGGSGMRSMIFCNRRTVLPIKSSSHMLNYTSEYGLLAVATIKFGLVIRACVNDALEVCCGLADDVIN